RVQVGLLVQHVGFGYHADNPALAVDYRKSADPGPPHLHDHLFERRGWLDGQDLRRHHVFDGAPHCGPPFRPGESPGSSAPSMLSRRAGPLRVNGLGDSGRASALVRTSVPVARIGTSARWATTDHGRGPEWPGMAGSATWRDSG